MSIRGNNTITHLCESCHRHTELIHCRSADEHLCEDCIMALAISYYEANKQPDEDCIDCDAE